MGKFSLAEQMRARSPAQEPRTIEVITQEILACKVRAGEAILEIGRCLLEAKGQLDHGQWCTWLEERVEFSERQAQRFMRLAREWSNPTALSDLGATKALTLLALDPSEREAFIAEAHSVNGAEKTVIDMSARELEKAIREREEAIADKKAAEASRAQMEADMRVANDRLAAMNDELRQKEQSAQEAAQHADALRQELEELRAQPIEVVGAAVPDETALNAAREEGAKLARTAARREAAMVAEEKLKKKLEQAEQEKQAALEALERAKAEAQESTAAYQAQAQAAMEGRAALEKRLKLAANPAAAEFQFQFSAAREDFNRLLDCLERLREEGETDLHDRLATALEALARQLLERIPEKLEGGAAE